MYCRAIACDFDGTGAVDGHPAPELYAALAAARSQGIVTLLVTGRVLDDVQRSCEELSPFDVVVAENGAIVHICGTGRTIQIGEPPSEHFLGALRARGIPFHAGAVVIGTWEQYANKLLELIRRLGIDGQLIFNRAALMLLPTGINKALGVQRALEELGRSERNLIAFGDAENDIPMLAGAELGVAARNSVAAVSAMADDSISQPGGAGVALYVRRLIERNGIVPTPRRRSIVIGRNAAGAEVTLPGSGYNLVISGDPRSGKSWIAGLLVERLVEQGYRICIIDPEGDYPQMAQRCKIITFGHEISLPEPQAAARLLSNKALSTVFTLASLSPVEQVTYVDRLMAGLEETRSAAGIPHWIVIDEAHLFFGPQSSCLKYLENPNGGICLVTYRPSLLAGEAYDHLGGHIFTSTRVEEERYFATKILQAHSGIGLTTHNALDDLEPPRAGLLMTNGSKPGWQEFIPGERITKHAHHARKYADTRLPEGKAFRFLSGDDLSAHNMNEFYYAIKTVPLPALRHHLVAGDFSRWVSEVLGDQQLARGLRKLERATPAGATPDRAEILAHIQDHYLIQEQ